MEYEVPMAVPPIEVPLPGALWGIVIKSENRLVNGVDFSGSENAGGFMAWSSEFDAGIAVAELIGDGSVTREDVKAIPLV